jgi:hypothetical protein
MNPITWFTLMHEIGGAPYWRVSMIPLPADVTASVEQAYAARYGCVHSCAVAAHQVLRLPANATNALGPSWVNWDTSEPLGAELIQLRDMLVAAHRGNEPVSVIMNLNRMPTGIWYFGLTYRANTNESLQSVLEAALSALLHTQVKLRVLHSVASTRD